MVTATQVWEAITADASFLATIPEGEPRDIYRGMVEQAVALLAPLAERKATFGAFVEAKCAIVAHYAETGFARRLIMAMPPEMLDGEDTQADLAADTQAGAEEMAAFLAPVVPQLADLPEGAMIEEMLFFAPAYAKLNSAARTELARGTLTIGRLLLLDPASLFGNE